MPAFGSRSWAIFAWTTCFLVTILVSLATRPYEDQKLVGLVYALTKHEVEKERAWYQRPEVLALIVLGATLLLNIVFL